ncbi:DUF1989 domain-containing protein [Chloroflexota bacterium]
MTKDGKATKSRRVIEEFVIPKCSSKAFVVKQGQVLRVIAHAGKQVADIRFLNAHDYREQFSSWLSWALNMRQGIGGMKRLKKLYSQLPWHRVMLTVIDDKVGNHLLFGQCNRTFYELKGQLGHANCADLFEECLKPFHISMVDLDSASVFNVFMSVRYLDDENGTYEIQRPSCEKGDYIDFLAEMDVLVAATSCPADTITNDFEPKSMKFQILV